MYCTEPETCISYRNRRLVRGSSQSLKQRMRKRGIRKLLFSVAPVIGTCGLASGTMMPDGRLCG